MDRLAEVSDTIIAASDQEGKNMQPTFIRYINVAGSYEKNTSYCKLIHDDHCTLLAKLRSLCPSFSCLARRDDDNFRMMIRR